MISVITKYFPDLTERQRAQYESLYGLYADWNAKINVVRARTSTSSTCVTCSTRWP